MMHSHSSCRASAQTPTFAGSPCHPVLPEHMEGPGLNQASHALKCSIALHRRRPQRRLRLHGGQRFALKDRLCWAALALYGRACTAQDAAIKTLHGVLALHVGQQTGLDGEGKPLLAGVQVGPLAGRECNALSCNTPADDWWAAVHLSAPQPPPVTMPKGSHGWRAASLRRATAPNCAPARPCQSLWMLVLEKLAQIAEFAERTTWLLYLSLFV